MKTTRFLLFTVLLFIGLANADTIASGNAEEEAVEWYITVLALLTPVLCLYAAWKFLKFILKLASGFSSVTSGGTFTDPRDGKVYKTIKAGNQVWMAENLAYDAPGSKFYDNKEENGKKYGRLYDWKTAKNACPPGWHLPSNEELDYYHLMSSFTKADWHIPGKRLKAKSGWNSDNGKSGNGTDKIGFAGLPGGYRLADGRFLNIGNNGNWWSSTENSSYAEAEAYTVRLSYNNNDFPCYYCKKDLLFSVRCVKD